MTQRKVAPPDLIDLLRADYKKSEDLIGENGILKQLTKAIVERALQAELTVHLGYDKHEAVSNERGNTRNGSSTKTLKGDFGALPIEIPRDRDGGFEPQLIAKHQTRWTGFDDKVLSLYARGMTVREIQSHLEEMYDTALPPTLISSVTEAVVRKSEHAGIMPHRKKYGPIRGRKIKNQCNYNLLKRLCVFHVPEATNIKATIIGDIGTRLAIFDGSDFIKHIIGTNGNSGIPWRLPADLNVIKRH
jgi:hypothetical protein